MIMIATIKNERIIFNMRDNKSWKETIDKLIFLFYEEV